MYQGSLPGRGSLIPVGSRRTRRDEAGRSTVRGCHLKHKWKVKTGHRDTFIQGSFEIWQGLKAMIIANTIATLHQGSHGDVPARDGQLS